MIIDKMYAFVAIEDGIEGVCAVYSATENTWLPLVTAKETNLNSMTLMAEDINRRSGSEIKLIEFSTRNVIKTL